MPDQYGLPTVGDVYVKLNLTAPDDISDDVENDIAAVLASVIADFEAPVGPDTSEGPTGGTGRLWQPRQETRFYDGNGYGELRIDDIVPPGVDAQGNVTNPLVAQFFDTVLTNVGVKQASQGKGSNVLCFAGGGALAFGWGRRLFARGVNNIAVTATFGNVATADIFEALRCEACYLLLVEAFVGLNGVGEDVKVGDYELNTSVGAINFKLTSPLTVFHDKYQKAIVRYRERAERNWRNYAASRHLS